MKGGKTKDESQVYKSSGTAVFYLNLNQESWGIDTALSFCLEMYEKASLMYQQVQ